MARELKGGREKGAQNEEASQSIKYKAFSSMESRKSWGLRMCSPGESRSCHHYALPSGSYHRKLMFLQSRRVAPASYFSLAMEKQREKMHTLPLPI